MKTLADPTQADPAASGVTREPKPIAQVADAVQKQEAKDAGSGGGGREETPRNAPDATQGSFHDPEQDRLASQTPG